jgi:heme-degrading monooxygenase HmoA
MIMTTLDGEVPEESWDALVNKYNEILTDITPGIIETFLIHDTKNPIHWRIVTIWESKEAIEKMRNSGTPGGVLVFRAAGTEPTLSIFEVAATATS